VPSLSLPMRPHPSGVSTVEMMSASSAFLLATLAASTTMIGWVIASSGRSWSPRIFGLMLLLVAAAMVVISGAELLPAAVRSGLPLLSALAWATGGAIIVLAMRQFSRLIGANQSSLLLSAGLIAVAIGLHNFPEGAATAAAALLSVETGVVTAVAVGLHNVPEGIAVAAPVIAGGGSRTRAFWYTGVATAGEVLGAASVLFLAETLDPSRVAALLAGVSGLMITLSLVEIAPTGLSLFRQTESERPLEASARSQTSR